jgi:predicted alpha/beta hydrolase
VLHGVLLRSLVVMVIGMQRVPMRDLGMMCGLFVVAGFGMFGSFAVMLGRVIVMLGGLFVMLVNVVFMHIVTIHRRLPVRIVGNGPASPGSVKHLRRDDDEKKYRRYQGDNCSAAGNVTVFCP